MNAVELIVRRTEERPKAAALWLPEGGVTTFGELGALAVGVRARMERLGVGPGDTVLMFDSLGPRLYGAILAIASLGAATALVEPWMPVEKINHVLPFVRPKVFLTSGLGRLWGARIASIRAIPHWVSTSSLRSEGGAWEVTAVGGNAPAIITFTSGTTGSPKGMVRTHQYLSDQHRILQEALHGGHEPGADICIFANFALSNLAAGNPSLIVPPKWKSSHLRQLDGLTGELTPKSVTCGPAFLLRLMAHAKVPTLESIHVGGALTDCSIFERGFAKWATADWKHVYGSTEVEPVAVVDAREAVRRSREAGFFQTLYLGKPIAAIQSELAADTVWVSGPHVCPRYLANDEENAKYKRQDPDGAIWHRMGDRIVAKDGGWWYSGREKLPIEDFLIEQKLYSLLSTSAGFVERDASGVRVFVQKAKARESIVRNGIEGVTEVRNVMIRRDRRHRARIDRAASRRASWVRG